MATSNAPQSNEEPDATPAESVAEKLKALGEKEQQQASALAALSTSAHKIGDRSKSIEDANKLVEQIKKANRGLAEALKSIGTTNAQIKQSIQIPESKVKALDDIRAESIQRTNELERKSEELLATVSGMEALISQQNNIIKVLNSGMEALLLRNQELEALLIALRGSERSAPESPEKTTPISTTPISNGKSYLMPLIAVSLFLAASLAFNFKQHSRLLGAASGRAVSSLAKPMSVL